jgi:hypothetical protein
VLWSGRVHSLHKYQQPAREQRRFGVQEAKARGPSKPMHAREVKGDRLIYKIGGFGMSQKKGPGKSPPELLLHSREYDNRVDTRRGSDA